MTSSNHIGDRAIAQKLSADCLRNGIAKVRSGA
jgi:hypothetical protein